MTPSKVKVGQEFEVEVRFKNPLGIPLTDGVIHIEGAGTHREKKVHLKYVRI